MMSSALSRIPCSMMRFRLSTLFLLTTLMACALAWRSDHLAQLQELETLEREIHFRDFEIEQLEMCVEFEAKKVKLLERQVEGLTQETERRAHKDAAIDVALSIPARPLTATCSRVVRKLWVLMAWCRNHWPRSGR